LLSGREKVDTALFWDSLRSMRYLIRGERVFNPKLKRKVWVEKPSLKAIELLWEAHGRLPRGRGRDESRGGDTITNTQVNVLTREEAKAAMALLRQERERQERERAIELDPSQVETGGGTEERS
jgi:hypothetical protein